ncbi:nicotinamide riboside kinase 1-like isoform X2 [Macrosteles quadrilineatus]|uniref:nicotinamide riboside kinase 1-like isoform X2 n=1 Tax=Macrosteles quadrilineatus TaxID=74068 RepID=UPI0023E1BDD2|nr:nicotinamide riboside kinase 1-like isoform X2 [Macrosteles quadrilineatus]
MSEKKWTVVGVSGVTCGGKTTFAAALRAEFPDATVVSQDDYFLPPDDPRHTHLPELNHINWEIATALDMDRMVSDIREILTRPMSEVKLPLLIIEGFLIFTDRYISSVCQHQLFFQLTREECWARRSVRTYDPPDVPGYFEQVVWPEYERHLQLALTISDNLQLIPGTRDNHSVVQEYVELLTKELSGKS